MELDRSALAQALAKAIAYKQVGNQHQANVWAARLMYLLDTMDICDQAKLDQLAKEWK